MKGGKELSERQSLCLGTLGSERYKLDGLFKASMKKGS